MGDVAVCVNVGFATGGTYGGNGEGLPEKKKRNSKELLNVAGEVCGKFWSTPPNRMMYDISVA